MEQYAIEWKRILKPNGSLFCFCSSEMSARLEVMFSKYFNILSQIVWTKPNEAGFDGWKQKTKKESLRQWYPSTERIIFAEQNNSDKFANESSGKADYKHNLRFSLFGDLIRQAMINTKTSTIELTEAVGAYGKVNHGGSASNWINGLNIPTLDQFFKIRSYLNNKGGQEYFSISYEKLSSEEHDNMYKAKQNTDYLHINNVYIELRRPFNVSNEVQYTDVWNFKSVRPYKNKHPAEKPLDLLKHAIESTTYPNDIVLDCFSGSGNVAIAASLCKRKSILMEIDPKWVNIAKERLSKIAPLTE